MKIIITGGYGFIGTSLLLELLKRYPNHKILNIDNLTYASNHKRLKFLLKYKNYKHEKIDISNYKKLQKAFLRFKPNIVFNLAAETHVDKSIINPHSFIKTNIIGTYNLLNISNHYFRTSSKNFIFFQVSTDEVYGDLTLRQQSFREDSNIKPSSPYSASKASADHLVLSYYRTFKLPVIISRCSNNYGPYQYKEKLIPRAIQNILKNIPVPIYNRGLEIRDWINVRDHVDALINLSKKGKIGNIYNIGSNNEIKNLTLVKKIITIIEKKIKRKLVAKNLIKFVKDRPGHDFRYSIDCKKIKRHINWVPKIDFEKGLNDTIDWYINNK